MRKICVAYWLLLTLVLWVRDPLKWFHTRTVDTVYNWVEPVAHFTSFTVLALIVLATGLSLSRVWLLAILAGYGCLTELVQSQVGRHMELKDLLQDFAGILVGTGLFTAWQRIRKSKEPVPPQEVWQQPRRRSEPAPGGQSNQ
jgi:VanZ family protein